MQGITDSGTLFFKTHVNFEFHTNNVLRLHMMHGSIFFNRTNGLLMWMNYRIWIKEHVETDLCAEYVSLQNKNLNNKNTKGFLLNSVVFN